MMISVSFSLVAARASSRTCIRRTSRRVPDAGVVLSNFVAVLGRGRGYSCELFLEVKSLATFRTPCVTLPQNIKAKPAAVPSNPERGIIWSGPM